MMPSDVLSYIQMGHFLMLVMTVSWFFSVFFFQSLCAIAGPQDDTGQLSLKKMQHWLHFGKESKKEKTNRRSLWEEKKRVTNDEKETEQEDIDENSVPLVDGQNMDNRPCSDNDQTSTAKA